MCEPKVAGANNLAGTVRQNIDSLSKVACVHGIEFPTASSIGQQTDIGNYSSTELVRCVNPGTLTAKIPHLQVGDSSTTHSEMVSVLPAQLPRMPVENGINPVSSVLLPQRNSFRPKKKLTRLVNGLNANQYSFPQHLFLTSVPKTNTKKNVSVPQIIIDAAEDELRPVENTQAPKRRLVRSAVSYTRPGLNCNAKFLHPSYTVCAAVSANDPGALKNIILSGTVNIDQATSSGASALHEAAYDGKIGCVQALIQCGADVNIVDGEGWTPLHAAVCGRNKLCVELLIRRDANVIAKTYDGLTPQGIALQQKDRDMIKLLTSLSNKTHTTNRSKAISYKQAKESFVPSSV